MGENKIKYYDFIVCHLNPNIESYNLWVKELNSLKLNYKIIFINLNENIKKIESKNFEYLNLKEDIKIEENSIYYAYKNFEAPYFFLVGRNDNPIDFKIFYLNLKKDKKDFVVVQEKLEGYYTDLFRKNITNTSLSPGSSYVAFSKKFLVYIFENIKINNKFFKNDLIWESILLSENNKNIKIGNYLISGANSKINKNKILNLKINTILKNKISYFISYSFSFLLILFLNFRIIYSEYLIYFIIFFLYLYVLKKGGSIDCSKTIKKLYFEK